MSKNCIACGELKELSEFYKHPKMADGHLGICKECHKARMRLRQRTNPAVQAYDRARSKLDHRKERARLTLLRWREANPEAYKAQTAVNNAIRDGRLEKGAACETCGSPDDLHAHHDDYSKPLEVRWMCALHHHRLHADEPKEEFE